MPGGSILGHAVKRLEDRALLTGTANYVGNMAPPGVVHLAFVRSLPAHAEITAVDMTAALESPGVIGVFSAAEVDIEPQPSFLFAPPACNRAPLADGVVRYVGDPIAVVVAETPAAAVDGAELVEVDYEPKPVVVDPAAAMAADAPVLFAEHGSNLAIPFSNRADPETLTGHDLVVSASLVNHRMAGMPLEPSAVLAAPGIGNGSGSAAGNGTGSGSGNAVGDTAAAGAGLSNGVTVWCTSQTPHGVQAALAAALQLDPSAVRVIAPAVGGGFGSKAVVYPEFLVAAWLARHLDRPVKWVETRSENLVNMTQGRDYTQHYELGLKHDGTICWLRANCVANIGGYATVGCFLPSFTMNVASGPYRIPVVAFDATTVLTNTTPVAAFRGAGRPEATTALERIMDLAALELGLDPVELRRRNLLRSDEFPCTTPTGANMDSGDYLAALELALEMAGYDGLRAEQRRRREAADPMLLGIGVSVYVEVTAGGLVKEYGSVTVESDGTIVARVGTAPQGQGHTTAFTQIISEILAVEPEQVRIIHGDTAEVPRGIGTIASRSLQIGGSALWTAANDVLARARLLAAHRLEASVDDIVVAGGGLEVAGVPSRALSWAELAATAGSDDLPEGFESGRLAAETDFDQGESTYPFGAHVAVAEIDSETGDTRLLRHVAVDDCGRILNPMLVDGQVHGGIAQGVAQALYERVVYDSEGNPRTANLGDYCMPSAVELPRYETAHTSTPTPLNPLGAKGIGESGTIGSTPAVQSAVIDALSHLGIRHLDMPYTPERVWRAISQTQTHLSR